VSPNVKGRNFKPKGTWWNCGDKGHYRNKCPKPARGQNNKKVDSPKGSGSANATVESDDEGEAAFFAELNDEEDMPVLLSDCETDSDIEEDGAD
jgi:hypothetical protein